MKPKFLIAVAGPTAIGKTARAIELASHYQTDVISCDSRQFFKEMTIGTAVPSAQELAAAAHHFIQHKSVEEPYSVGDFENDAMAWLQHWFENHDLAVMVGGSGLYMDAVAYGLDDFPDIDTGIRDDISKLFQTEGIEALQRELAQSDPEYFRLVDRRNPQRLMRALEVCRGTGKPYSSFRKGKNAARPFTTIFIGLDAPRELLYDRINHRVDDMLAAGLKEEAKSLYRYRHLNALQTVGYRELFHYFDGNITWEDAVDDIKKNTRRFAKRQLTWFRRNPEIQWFGFDAPLQALTDYIDQKIESKKKPG